MHVDSINLQTKNNLIQDYRTKKTSIMQYFDYDPFESDVFKKRAQDLQHKNVNREQLADVLHMINTEWDAPSSTIENIRRFREGNTLVVIGGQQAGLLTGPMYTINKIISIIQLAKQQEKQLNTPVIPVFWIAGEDHDFDEINHIFLQDKSKMNKFTLLQRVIEKEAISNISIHKEKANEWLKSLFLELDETLHTKELYETLATFLSKSDTYVDFFAQVVFWLFEEEGLVLVDSNNSQIRELESIHFTELIYNQAKTTGAIEKSLKEVEDLGYSLSVEVNRNDANLFYQNGSERILLVRDNDNNWVGKNREVKFSTEELVFIAENQPYLLSNNVMTRPLMQEMLFPSLAFIGGPGEISYWSVLKGAFHANNMKMPPVIPRLSYTFLEPNIEKLISKYNVSVEKTINVGVTETKCKWLDEQQNPPVNQLANKLKQTIEQEHRPIRDLAKSIRADVGGVADKNLDYLMRDIEFLEKRITKTLQEIYARELDEFNLLQTALHPNGGLQERMWNPLPFINQYSKRFITNLVNEPCSYENEHYIVYL
ncbi:bacillithiol biosynthesis cysteine-adding enzyme BshC [Virgibacillus sp. DJP39]|uniref:bacillithiol biosynthesis cysteine-adding enzyme BshC n=1 Tax=Virgibacillus sp. DJP39 TaxID=3409790 RepID=UPI003BB6D751